MHCYHFLSLHRYIYHEYCRPNEDPKGWGQAVRFNHWKAVRYNNNDTTVELYDLDKDLSETDDVSSDNPDVVKMAVTYMNTAHVQGHYCDTHIDENDLD